MTESGPPVPTAVPDPRPLTIAVTGYGGFVGGRVVRMARGAGWAVRGVGRRAYTHIDSPDLPVARLDLASAEPADHERLARHFRGCDAVIHTAALAGVWGPLSGYHVANVVATRNVIAACRAAGVPALVHTSTPSVVFDGRDMCGVDESAPYATRHHSHYSATKAVAEREALATDTPGGLRVCALRPHLVWGPGDNHLVPRIVARSRAGRLRRVGDGRNVVDTTFIDDAAAAHLAAARALIERPDTCGGRAFFISQGQPVPLWDMVSRILAAAGAPPLPALGVARPVAWCAGAVLEAAYGAFRVSVEPPMTRFVANELATSHWFDISAARRDLGYSPRHSIESGLDQLARWFRDGCPR